MEPEVLATALAKAALEKKAKNVAILDLRNLVDYADLFVICSANNRRQVQAIADEVRRTAREELSERHIGIEGVEAARWVLVDFGSVIVHIFDEPLRAFYNLDGLWADAPRLPLPEVQVEAEEEEPFLD